MIRSCLLGLLAILLLLFSSSAESEQCDATVADFMQLTNQLAEGWNQNDATMAANVFSDNAIYIDPPDRQLYQGREALFNFFGGLEGRAASMHMVWHHRAFNEKTCMGFGEWTFEFGGEPAHGVTVIELKSKKINTWREYWYDSPLQFEEFIGPSER